MADNNNNKNKNKSNNNTHKNTSDTTTTTSNNNHTSSNNNNNMNHYDSSNNNNMKYYNSSNNNNNNKKNNIEAFLPLAWTRHIFYSYQPGHKTFPGTAAAAAAPGGCDQGGKQKGRRKQVVPLDKKYTERAFYQRKGKATLDKNGGQHT